MNGFTIHASRKVKTHQRGQLEGLINCMARSAISSERLSQRPDGNLEYKMKRRFSDGSEKLILSPPELIEKLVAVIPQSSANHIEPPTIYPARSRQLELVHEAADPP